MDLGAGVRKAGARDAPRGLSDACIDVVAQAGQKRSLRGRGFIEAVEPDLAICFGKLLREPLFTAGGGEPAIALHAAFEFQRPAAEFGGIFRLFEGGVVERELVLLTERPGLRGPIGGRLPVE